MISHLILIVEDDEKSRRLLHDILQFKGYRTIETDNAEQALLIAHAQRPDLILMDYHLPVMTGIEALHLLRADPKTQDILVMAVTASAMSAEQQLIQEAGFDATAIKPIEVEHFLMKIAELLALRSGG